MTHSIAPALTPEEWEAKEFKVERGLTTITHYLLPNGRAALCVTDVVGEMPTLLDPEASHALAALCLHQQPFGFTMSDVVLLLAIGDSSPDSRMPTNWLQHSKDLAARVQALLSVGSLQDVPDTKTSKRGGKKP